MDQQDGYERREVPDIPQHFIAPFTAGMRMVVGNRTNGANHNYRYVIVGTHWITLYTNNLAPHASRMRLTPTTRSRSPTTARSAPPTTYLLDSRPRPRGRTC